METKFKTGDIVKVMPYEWYDFFNDKDGNVMPKDVGVDGAKHYFTAEMAKWCGTCFEIIDLIDGGYKVYGMDQIFEDWMIENKKFNRNQNKIEESMETKKMTLAEAQELVKNTKYIVWSEDESRRLQEKLFEIGCKWASGRQEFCNAEHPFLYVNENMKLSYSYRGIYMCFEESKKRYMPTEDIFNIELEQSKPKFDPRTLKPFDKVLVKNEGETWNVDFFDRYFTEKKAYLCISGLYSFCIPYNEETKYLHGNGNKEPEFYQQD